MEPQGLGELEQLVLLAVMRLADEAYAVSVRREIEARTGRSISRGAVYVTLDRMERKGYLRSRMGPPTRERGGKAKRIFRMESAGTAALRNAIRHTRAMLQGLTIEREWSLSP